MIIAIVASASATRADRGTYTIEDVRAATMIGVWCADHLHEEGGALLLDAPSKTFDGEMTWPRGITNSSRLVRAASSILSGPCGILFVKHRVVPAHQGNSTPARESLDLTSDSGGWPLTDANVKLIQETVQLNKLIRKEWPSLSAAERWRKAEVVLIGIIARDPMVTCPEILWVESRTVCKGGAWLPDRPGVIVPDTPGSADERLFFLARNPGSGPPYVVLGSEPATSASTCPPPPSP